MTVNRRSFFLAAPAAALGMDGLASLAFAQASRTSAKVAPEVVDFWVNGMGLSPDAVIGGAKTRGPRPNGPQAGNVGREPLFLHYNPDTGGLITADQVPIDKLTESGDTDVQFQMVRMRLNPDDEKQFSSYTSGGIYVDFQQAPTQAGQSLTDILGGFASTLFGSISPPKGNSSSKSSSSGKSSSTSKSNFLPQKASSSSGGGTAIPLQSANQALSISLSGGTGRHSFACFAKDKRKSLFGQFVSVFETLSGSTIASYLPMLAMPGVGPAALTAVRSLVANLQAHGGDQQWIMMSQPIDVVTTQEGAKNNPNALRLRPGSYIMIPKEHASQLQGQLGALTVMDGFLVPQKTDPLGIYDAYPSTAPGVSYISVNFGVQPSKNTAGRVGK